MSTDTPELLDKLEDAARAYLDNEEAESEVRRTRNKMYASRNRLRFDLRYLPATVRVEGTLVTIRNTGTDRAPELEFIASKEITPDA